ncbi:hypothetical protein R3P38DRAFT_2849146 [Favolaschia claudopus]|uniref:Secreted protein n=1 Tax=Favolaschia claudopus TaxID=2862362 RepID=A0AAW0DX57_9AGAR
MRLAAHRVCIRFPVFMLLFIVFITSLQHKFSILRASCVCQRRLTSVCAPRFPGAASALSLNGPRRYLDEPGTSRSRLDTALHTSGTSAHVRVPGSANTIMLRRT